MLNSKSIKRQKALLTDVGQTNIWLAEQLSKDSEIVNKWCTNIIQRD